MSLLPTSLSSQASAARISTGATDIQSAETGQHAGPDPGWRASDRVYLQENAGRLRRESDPRNLDGRRPGRSSSLLEPMSVRDQLLAFATWLQYRDRRHSRRRQDHDDHQ